jgi:hypothetical protein
MPENLLRYKYLPITGDSLKIITEGTIKFSAPSEFNDPFDCSPDYDVQKHLEYVSGRKDLLKKAGEKLGFSPAKRLQNKKKMLKNVERATSQEDYGGRIAEQTGICCLSRDPLNLLMWAHYAKNHTGFVVEFSIPQNMECTKEEVSEIIIGHLFPLKVEYSKEKPVIDSNDDNDTNLNKQFLTKSIDWVYEQEERVIDYIRGSGIHPYKHTTILKSVIAGLKMTDDDYDTLKSVITEFNKKTNSNVQLYKAIKTKGQFAIHVPERLELSDCAKKI